MITAANRYLEDEILTASPLQLVSLLYQGAISELRSARKYLAAGDIKQRCAAIGQACDILTELTCSLNPEAGGETAERLAELYAYCISLLLTANLHKKDEPLVEVLGLLTTLSEAWLQLANTERIPAAQLTSPAVYGNQAEHVSQSWSF